ncbi:MAG: hypothetical protein JJU37_03995 [Balneolaceae bacterium]|nr:hypothetical protein [Balneolaceae bacterium]
MKKLILMILAFIVLTILAVSCSDNPTIGRDLEEIVIGENFTFIKSVERAEQTGEQRSGQVSDPFVIDDVRIETVSGTKLMFIDVTQAEGCAEPIPEKFEVIWDGIMLMIYPPQVAFYLTFNASVCEVLESNVEETIVLDLHEHFGDFDDSAQYTVVNASKSVEDNDIQVNR